MIYTTMQNQGKRKTLDEMLCRKMELLVSTHFTPAVKSMHLGGWKKGGVKEKDQDSAPPPMVPSGHSRYVFLFIFGGAENKSVMHVYCFESFI